MLWCLCDGGWALLVRFCSIWARQFSAGPDKGKTKDFEPGQLQRKTPEKDDEVIVVVTGEREGDPCSVGSECGLAGRSYGRVTQVPTLTALARCTESMARTASCSWKTTSR